jgi:cytochrome bd-type quinol oxidase subunit 2
MAVGYHSLRSTQQAGRKFMQRRSLATIVCFVYAAYWGAVLFHGLRFGTVGNRLHLVPWLIFAILGLLCYGMAVGRSWARGAGLAVAIGGLILWPVSMVAIYFFSLFGDEAFSPRMVQGIVPPLVFSILLVVLFAKPLPAEREHSETKRTSLEADAPKERN